MSWNRLIKRVLAFEPVSLLETYGHDIVDGVDYSYDVHGVKGGVNVTYELLPQKQGGYGTSVGPGWLSPDVFIMPYSGFAFPKETSGSAAADDHLYYQGPMEGVDLLAFGPTKDDCIRKMRLVITGNQIVRQLARLRKR